MTYFNPFLSVPRWISSCGGKGLSKSGITSPSTLSSPNVDANAEVIDFHLFLPSSPLPVVLLLLLFVSEDNSPPIPPPPPGALPQNTFLFLNRCFGALRVDAMNLLEETTNALEEELLLVVVPIHCCRVNDDDDDDDAEVLLPSSFLLSLLKDDDDDDDDSGLLLETRSGRDDRRAFDDLCVLNDPVEVWFAQTEEPIADISILLLLYVLIRFRVLCFFCRVAVSFLFSRRKDQPRGGKGKKKKEKSGRPKAKISHKSRRLASLCVLASTCFFFSFSACVWAASPPLL
jgi:hypothetical protein